MNKIFLITVCLIIFAKSIYAQIFVALDGDDNNAGTKDAPYQSFSKAVLVAVPGDTIYVRGGTYEITNTITISTSKIGTEDQLYTFKAYQDEMPVLDFSQQNQGTKGIIVKADYWHFKGLQITGSGDNGMLIDGGSNNVIENCTFYENRDTGLQLSDGASDNRIINCDSYYNADPPDYGNADGFAPKLDVGSGNFFYGCRAWGNSDDGWDGYLRGADDVTTTLENCWTWGNGYLKDGADPGPQANGNGFKMGGGDNSNSQQLMHHNILINCVSFNNKNKGFDQNNNVGSMTLLNCTGYDNQTANYRIQRGLNPGQSLTIKNCVSFRGNVQLGAFAEQETNSWLAPFIVSGDDFLSLDVSLASMPRQSDGSLPDIEFLHLAQGSDLIDAGVDLGYPFRGVAPDIGAFESDFVTSVVHNVTPRVFRLFQNYPNPFNPDTIIEFQLPKADNVEIKIYNALGEQVTTLFDGYLSTGLHNVKFNPGDLPSGIYFYEIETNSFSQLRKMMLVK